LISIQDDLNLFHLQVLIINYIQELKITSWK